MSLRLWLVRQNLDFFALQRARPQAGFLELAVEMMDDLAALHFRPNQQRLIIFYQRSAARLACHELSVAEQSQVLAVIPPHEIMPPGRLHLRNWKTNPRQTFPRANLKMNLRSSCFRRISAGEGKIDVVRACSFRKERSAPEPFR